MNWLFRGNLSETKIYILNKKLYTIIITFKKTQHLKYLYNKTKIYILNKKLYTIIITFKKTQHLKYLYNSINWVNQVIIKN